MTCWRVYVLRLSMTNVNYEPCNGSTAMWVMKVIDRTLIKLIVMICAVFLISLIKLN